MAQSVAAAAANIKLQVVHTVDEHAKYLMHTIPLHAQLARD
jgi:hypothetical protein